VAGRYPDAFGDKVFEVHHRAPLSKASAPVRTTLDDLAVLCANCHRTVHSTKDVDENFRRLRTHFARRS
jgi:predicted HNH restriction endonuclease